jgi:hypothetical protein
LYHGVEQAFMPAVKFQGSFGFSRVPGGWLPIAPLCYFVSFVVKRFGSPRPTEYL